MTDWYAAYTYPRHEKKVAAFLSSSGMEAFLPLYKEVSKWKNGQRMVIERPLFPSYIFVKLAEAERTRVLQVPSVAGLVQRAGMPVPIPSSEIESIREGVSQLEVKPHPFLNRGDRVRFKSGPFADHQGVLVNCRNQWRVVISIDVLMQAVSVEVDLCDVERIPSN